MRNINPIHQNNQNGGDRYVCSSDEVQVQVNISIPGLSFVPIPVSFFIFWFGRI